MTIRQFYESAWYPALLVLVIIMLLFFHVFLVDQIRGSGYQRGWDEGRDALIIELENHT